MDESEKDNIISEIQSMNNKLMHYIVLLSNKNYEKSKFVNFALGKHAFADSELKWGNTVCVASQALNGRYQNWTTDIWHSDSLEKTHWLIVDLEQPRKAVKIVKKHEGSSHFNIVDFDIYGSNDMSDWALLSSTTGNDKPITIHEISTCTYRYFKLHITNPGEQDFCARICEFEVWGFETDDVI